MGAASTNGHVRSAGTIRGVQRFSGIGQAPGGYVRTFFLYAAITLHEDRTLALRAGLFLPLFLPRLVDTPTSAGSLAAGG